MVKLNYLASPPLVVAYAIAGSLKVDLFKDPLGTGSDGKPVYLKDIWPSNKEIDQVIGDVLTPAMFKARYSNVFEGPEAWREIDTGRSGEHKSELQSLMRHSYAVFWV